jgi:hypothetical protein
MLLSSTENVALQKQTARISIILNGDIIIWLNLLLSVHNIHE